MGEKAPAGKVVKALLRTSLISTNGHDEGRVLASVDDGAKSRWVRVILPMHRQMNGNIYLTSTVVLRGTFRTRQTNHVLNTHVMFHRLWPLRSCVCQTHSSTDLIKALKGLELRKVKGGSTYFQTPPLSYPGK